MKLTPESTQGFSLDIWIRRGRRAHSGSVGLVAVGFLVVALSTSACIDGGGLHMKSKIRSVEPNEVCTEVIHPGGRPGAIDCWSPDLWTSSAPPVVGRCAMVNAQGGSARVTAAHAIPCP